MHYTYGCGRHRYSSKNHLVDLLLQFNGVKERCKAASTGMDLACMRKLFYQMAGFATEVCWCVRGVLAGLTIEQVAEEDCK